MRRDLAEIIAQQSHWQRQLKITSQYQHAQKALKHLKEERRIRVNELIRVIQQLQTRGRWLYSLLPSKPRLKPLAAHQQSSIYDEEDDILNMAGLGDRQPSAIHFSPGEANMGNVGDIGDLMIEDDSVVNQLAGFAHQDQDRRGAQFDETGETAGRLLAGFEAVRERPGKGQERGRQDGLRLRGEEDEEQKEDEHAAVFWPSDIRQGNSPRMSPDSRRRRAKWTDDNQAEMDFEGRGKDESEVIVWPSANRNRAAQESPASSEWLKWPSQRDRLTTGRDQADDPATGLADTQRTAVGQKARNYLQENARTNFLEQVGGEQLEHQLPAQSPHLRPGQASPTKKGSLLVPQSHNEDAVIEAKPPQYDFE